jgi:endo-1,4-beta-xylanase
MKALYSRFPAILVCLSMHLAVTSGNSFAQLVTNGGFESSNTGIVEGTAVKGWLIQVANGINPPPQFEIVSDTVQQGKRALKVAIKGLGTNQWDIQAVADSIPAKQGTSYNFSVWAKAEKNGALVNFTAGNYSYSEYGAIRPATLTTKWKEFTLRFTVNDNQSFIRAPIHFNYSANDGNVIYIDNLKIADVNASKIAVVAEGESGKIGSDFTIQQDGGIKYVTTTKNYTGLASPGDTSRIITYQVSFQDSGYYNLFARIRVGSGGYDDDSFFYGRGFGGKRDTASADWVFINGLAGAGFSNVADYVDGPGTLGSQIWKWVNVTQNFYQGVSPAKSFYVSKDSLLKTFQIASREDGLQIDKIAFGKSQLYFTVDALNNGLPGSTTKTKPDSSKYYQGPPIAQGASKFLGNAYGDVADNIFQRYWNQLTPGNAGKWGSVAGTQDTSKWNWTGLDRAYKCAMDNNLIFKEHTLIWGSQQPSWISSLDSTQQIRFIETWFRMVGKRYPKIDMVDVVNEPLAGHNPPDGGGSPARANYKNALGGNGKTGWDWVIKAFTMARQYLPNAKLLINDFGIINDDNATNSYLIIINLLKGRGLIDGIGVQGHRFEFESANTSTLKSNLDKLAATGLPIYITEMDLGNLNNYGAPNDDQQLQLYKSIFPVLWEHTGVKGITLWGYLEGQMWQTTCHLVLADGTWRPAMQWLAKYIKDSITGVEQKANELPANFKLEQNYPNPFNPATIISFRIPVSAKTILKVYDILGREVTTLLDENLNAGVYHVTWNANNSAGSPVASGTYFYRLISGNDVIIQKMLLIR